MSKSLIELCEERIEVSEIGLKIFVRTYDKLCSLNYKEASDSISEGLRRATNYVNEKRSKNYNVLRNKYSI